MTKCDHMVTYDCKLMVWIKIIKNVFGGYNETLYCIPVEQYKHTMNICFRLEPRQSLPSQERLTGTTERASGDYARACDTEKHYETRQDLSDIALYALAYTFSYNNEILLTRKKKWNSFTHFEKHTVRAHASIGCGNAVFFHQYELRNSY
jgi:hypothetical protein